VAALLDEVPRALRGMEGAYDRAKPVRVAAATADLVSRLVPDAGQAAHRIVDVVATGAAAEDLPPRPVHGDLYEAQVFGAPDYSLGLIDLDDAGPGDPAMDAANFCAHLIALVLAVPRARKTLMAYRSLVRQAFLARLDVSPRELAWREALCMFALATGPFRVLDPNWPAEVQRRTDLALRLADAA